MVFALLWYVDILFAVLYVFGITLINTYWFAFCVSSTRYRSLPPQTTSHVTTASDTSTNKDYRAVLVKVTVVGCLKEVNDYVSRVNLSYDDDETVRFVISMKLKGRGQKAMVLTATQVLTMGTIHELTKC
ncbi:hypothetical protein Pcac1_g13746 [Phytophthora cactorum]|nr:hypothetical protein Pcac1_g13746 [Phytophthora cactorum]